MKTLFFLGSPKKTHLLFYLAKILQSLDRKVLVVDGTSEKLYKHHMELTAIKSPIVEFKGFDVAIECETHRDFIHYIEEQETQYDIVLIDVDHASYLDGTENVNKLLLVSNYDRYHLYQNDRLLSAFTALHSQNMTLVDHIIFHIEGIVNHMMFIQNPDEHQMYFITSDEDDESVHLFNQHFNTISFKGLSSDFQNVLTDMISDQLQEDRKQIKKAIRKLRKEK